VAPERDTSQAFGSKRRAIVIRSLVLAALALLAAGAVTPLLTTERFYFFSNTFSLASGLRQLVANDQNLIAGVIILFSLCVPVVKAAVIWFAASPSASRGALLVLADRFGKWSMLEVFIAALLIVALKLGPVVDTTLHYGAYLLAASVLLSGLASQLVAHERHSSPLFSSPVTLTTGAVGGAVAATVLIGLLNPDLLNLEALVGTPETRCVQRVLRLDRLYARASGAQSDYVTNLRQIDSESCPQDFRDAFDDYVGAWEKLEALDADDDGKPSLLARAGARLGLIATRDDRLEDIENAWAEIGRIALEYGIKAPAK
jgi:paraquat-inducible protein A